MHNNPSDDHSVKNVISIRFGLWKICPFYFCADELGIVRKAWRRKGKCYWTVELAQEQSQVTTTTVSSVSVVANVLLLTPVLNLVNFTQRRWDKIFDSLHLTIRVIRSVASPWLHFSDTSFYVNRRLQWVKHKNRRLRHLCLRIKKKQDIWFPLYRSPGLSPTRNSFWEDSVRTEIEQVYGGYGDGSMRRRDIDYRS